MATVEGHIQLAWTPQGPDFNYTTDQAKANENLRRVVSLCEDIRKVFDWLCPPMGHTVELTLDENEHPPIVTEPEADKQINAHLAGRALTATRYREIYNDVTQHIKDRKLTGIELPPMPIKDADDVVIQFSVADSTTTANPEVILGRKYREVNGVVICTSGRALYLGAASGNGLSIGYEGKVGGAPTEILVDFEL